MDAHLEEKQKRPRTVEGYRYHLDHYLKNWRNKAVADLSRQMVRDLFAELKRKHGEPTAASVMRTLRAVINTAMRIDETITANPVAALRVPATKRRKVAPMDLRDWWDKVMKLPPARRDLHVAMMLTGARRSSILNVRTADVDLSRETVTLTHMKTSDEPLTASAADGQLAMDRGLARSGQRSCTASRTWTNIWPA